MRFLDSRHADQDHPCLALVKDGPHLFETVHPQPVRLVDDDECRRVRNCFLTGFIEFKRLEVGRVDRWPITWRASRPCRHWKFRSPQSERVPSLSIQMHFHGNTGLLQRNVVSKRVVYIVYVVILVLQQERVTTPTVTNRTLTFLGSNGCSTWTLTTGEALNTKGG
jgi:hypothetical protein